MKTDFVKKGLVIVIVVLFVCVGISSAVAIKINISTNENTSDEFVKVPVQTFGLNGAKSYKKSITQQQYNELQILKERFKENFENADTMKESVGVYRDMVVSLNELRLLPDGISVKDVEKLVLGPYYYLDKLGLLSNKIIVDDSQQNDVGAYRLWFCQLTWAASNWWDYIMYPDFDELGFILRQLGFFLNKIAFGRNFNKDWQPPHESSIGWIQARNLLYEWKYDGTFWGGLDYLIEPVYNVYYYKSVHGFFGYNIDGCIFGYARKVAIFALI